MRSFFYHYNKPESQKCGEPRATVHWKGACHVVKGIVCGVPTATRARKTQPRMVVAGRCESIEFKDGVAWIY